MRKIKSLVKRINTIQSKIELLSIEQDELEKELDLEKHRFFRIMPRGKRMVLQESIYETWITLQSFPREGWKGKDTVDYFTVEEKDAFLASMQVDS